MLPSPDQDNVTIPHHVHRPPDYAPNVLHLALVATEFLGHLSPLALTPAWLALSAISCWPWADLRLPVAVLSLVFILADGVSLGLLPRLGRSFGPVTPTLLALALTRVTVIFAAGLTRPTRPGLWLTVALNVDIFALAFYATWIEPFRVEVTQEELHTSKINGPAPLRLLHVSDLHIERITRREQSLLRLIQDLAPDAIVLTGDYLTLGAIYDATAQSQAREFLVRMCETVGPHCPIYAIPGSPPVDHPDIVPSIFDGLPIHWILDTVREANINGHSIQIAGLRCTAERRRDAPRLHHLLDDHPREKFTLLLYHSPDLMPEAAKLGVDLYLCGHTHGGQICLPFWGALFTSSAFGKRYEAGRYQDGNTTLYVSRGLGMEGLGAPRARFLASPEIVLWTIR